VDVRYLQGWKGWGPLACHIEWSHQHARLAVASGAGRLKETDRTVMCIVTNAGPSAQGETCLAPAGLSPQVWTRLRRTMWPGTFLWIIALVSLRLSLYCW